MSNPGDEDATPVENAAQLAAYLADGAKDRVDWRIGTEHEKFGFNRRDNRPVPYQPSGISAVLEGLAPLGWKRVVDEGVLIGLSRDRRSISLEPGGQFELSGAPLADLAETAAEMREHLDELREAADPAFIGFAPLGFHPTATLDAMPTMPKSRYGIMRRYMPTVGSMGLDMMFRTCTVQVNLDFGDERDMVRKLRVGAALQPIATALFANSPFTEGRPNGFQSYRAHVWTDVDNARAGVPPMIFEPGFGFERYVDWVLDVPMYFVARDGRLRDVAGASFRRWMGGTEERLGGLRPTLGDFADHLTTAFPDVRLKRFMEMRGADAGTPAMMVAQSALWVGALYDDAALHAAEALVARHLPATWIALRAAVPRAGLAAPIGRETARDIARDLLAIANDGLTARGRGEAATLEPLHAIVAGAPTQSDRWLARFHGAWKGDATRIFAEAAV